MPLPSALAARLSKRGILSDKQQQQQQQSEVDRKLLLANYKGLSTCPNKNNIYHDCNYWCETHWKGAGVIVPDSKYVRNMQKLLFKYPLPNNWTEIFDKGIGRYYYWNMENDLVSWLPPRHPKSIKTQSAAKLREKRILTMSKEEHVDSTRNRHEKKRRHHHTANNNDNSDTTTNNSKHEKNDKEDEISTKHTDRKLLDRNGEDIVRRGSHSGSSRRSDERHLTRKKSRKNEVDPMDPAAYSDIPQGTWSDGLESNKARAADSTVSGALFQQRPYPAPGEVLAIINNKEKNKLLK